MSQSHTNLRDNYQHLLQPWTSVNSVGKEHRTPVATSDGVYISDDKGNALLDGPGGMWCVNVGHRRKEIADAMSAQVMSLSYSSPWYTTNGPAAQLAAKLSEHAPGDLNQVLFSTCGSTAVETALRFAMFYNQVLGRSEKKLILTREDAYHGSTYLSASVCGKASDAVWMDTADQLVVKLSSPRPSRRAAGQSEEAFADELVRELEQKIDDVGADRIAAFIGEPVMASGGVIVPPGNYFKRMRAVCKQHDILFISDEVVTAFGRLGHIFASDKVFDVQPDMITFAKGVTSGYFPLGGTLISQKLFDTLQSHTQENDGEDALFSHGFTYSSHPVGCAVALTNLDIMHNEQILEHVQALSPYFLSQLKTLTALPLVNDVRGVGLMACVDCTQHKSTETSADINLNVGKRIDAHCQSLGLLVRPLYDMCVMSPPLIITREQVDLMVNMLKQGIERTMADLCKEGLWSPV